jgi:hypothetical protein
MFGHFRGILGIATFYPDQAANSVRRKKGKGGKWKKTSNSKFDFFLFFHSFHPLTLTSIRELMLLFCDYERSPLSNKT